MNLSSVILDYEKVIESLTGPDVVIEEGHYYSYYRGYIRMFFYISQILTRYSISAVTIKSTSEGTYSASHVIGMTIDAIRAHSDTLRDEGVGEFISEIIQRPQESRDEWFMRLRTVPVLGVFHNYESNDQ